LTGFGLWRRAVCDLGGKNDSGFVASHGKHQFVQAFDERRGIIELPAFGQQRLVEQDMAPVAEACLVGLIFSRCPPP